MLWENLLIKYNYKLNGYCHKFRNKSLYRISSCNYSSNVNEYKVSSCEQTKMSTNTFLST